MYKITCNYGDKNYTLNIKSTMVNPVLNFKSCQIYDTQKNNECLEIKK